MSNQDWRWWIGREEESYDQQCGSREEAIEIARDEYEEGAWITEARKPYIRLSDYFDVEQFTLEADESAAEEHASPDGDGIIFELDPGQRASLDTAIKAAINKWQEQNQIYFSGYMFSETRNTEFVQPIVANP